MKISEKNYLLILLIFYAVGIVGISYSGSRDLFTSLSAGNLLLTFSVLVLANRDFSARFWISFLIVFLFGFLIEVLGVSTGLIFGCYSYGESLGWKWQGVPLIIGINWFILSLSARGLVLRFTKSKISLVIIPSILITVLDVLIEPVAVKLDFWSWEGGHIPFQNYFMWLVSGALIQICYNTLNIRPKIYISTAVFLIQAVFFIFLNWIL